MSSRSTQPSICAIALDETEFWNIPAEWADVIERIETVYYYDENVAVHAAEITPSFELWRLFTRAATREDTDDVLRDRIDSWVQEGALFDDEVVYVHIGRIEQLIAAMDPDPSHPSNDFRFRRIGSLEAELAAMDEVERMQALREDLSANHPL